MLSLARLPKANLRLHRLRPVQVKLSPGLSNLLFLLQLRLFTLRGFVTATRDGALASAFATLSLRASHLSLLGALIGAAGGRRVIQEVQLYRLLVAEFISNFMILRAIFNRAHNHFRVFDWAVFLR